jgi:hypothetical protein
LQNFRAGQFAYLAQRDRLVAGQREDLRVVLLLETDDSVITWEPAAGYR